MKNIKVILATILTGAIAWSCQSGPSKADQDYQKISSQMDSIKNINDSLKNEQQGVMSQYNSIKANMDTMKNVDSTKMANLAKYPVMFQDQDASFKKIDAMLSSEQDFSAKQKEGSLSDKEIEAQVDVMKKDQREIMDEQDKIGRELEHMRNDLAGYTTTDNANSNGMDQTKTGMQSKKQTGNM